MSKWIALSGLVALLLANVATAAENPTGTWKWSVEVNGQTRENTLELKLEGDKLTGSMPGRNNTPTEIEEGTFKDGTVSFKVTRTRGDQKRTTEYSGKLEGDTIKGTVKSTGRDGQPTSRDWTATRVKAP